MSSSFHDSDAVIRRQAAAWLVRRDRGLSARESVEFERWLTEDERHPHAMQRSCAAWTMLDRIPAPAAHAAIRGIGRRGRVGRLAFWTGLAAAAGLAIAFAPLHRSVPTAPAAAPVAESASGWTSPRIVTLSDGTLVRLNAGGEVHEHFTVDERRVRLARGEAHFIVAKNLDRPFIVRAGTVEARAVGTAFNVNLQSTAVEILVTEGIVAVTGEGPEPHDGATHVDWNHSDALTSRSAHSPADSARTATPRPRYLLTANQRVVVALALRSSDAAIAVTDLSHEQIARALAWQDALLRLSGSTLGDLVAKFERCAGRRLVLADADLAGLRIGGRFRADDVDGFVRLLEENYGIASETTADGTVVLRQRPAAARE